MRQQRIPGMSIAVIKDGAVVKAAGFGYADVARKIPSTPETVYKIGSLTKQFIAAGMMRLVQEGRITLDAPVTSFIANAPPTWKPITIRHLLTHTSGLRRDVGDGNEYVAGRTDAELVIDAFAKPLIFPPGTRGQYSNLGCARQGAGIFGREPRGDVDRRQAERRLDVRVWVRVVTDAVQRPPPRVPHRRPSRVHFTLVAFR